MGKIDHRYNTSENILIWLTRFLILFLPLMFLNPMRAHFYRLQFAEVLFFFTLLIFAGLLAFRRIQLPQPGWVFRAALLFIIFCFISAWFSSNQKQSFIECFKYLYLFLLASLIFVIGSYYHLRENFIKYLCASFLLVIFFGILGIILLPYVGENYFADKSYVIPVALSLQDLIHYVPRITSVLKPTGNMLGTYIAGSFLIVISYYQLSGFYKKYSWMNLCLLVFICIFAFFSMSRSVVGVLLAAGLALLILNYKAPFRRIFGTLFILSALVLWLTLTILSLVYPVKFSMNYLHDPYYKKQMVVMKKGEARPNPIYFMRKGIGLEKYILHFDYGIHHYAWLKYAGFEIFKRHQLLGIGPGNFSKGMADLVHDGLIDQSLTAYRAAQSQYFTLLAENGLFGFFIMILLVVILLAVLMRRYLFYRNSYDLALFLSLIILAIAAIDIEILAFRWLWGLIAIILIKPEDRIESYE